MPHPSKGLTGLVSSTTTASGTTATATTTTTANNGNDLALDNEVLVVVIDLVEQEVRVALEPVGDTLRLLHLDDTVNVVLELVADHNIGTVALSRVVNGHLSISINGCLHAGVEHVTLGVADEAMGHVNPLDVHVDRVDDAAVDPAMDLVLALGVNDELVVKVLLAGGAADEVCRSVAHGCGWWLKIVV